MSVRSTRIWVLITDGVSSKLCSCQDGTAMPITVPLDIHGPVSDAQDLKAYSAWFKTERRSLSQNPRRLHVEYVCQLLLEAARERAYDGLVIIAAAPIAAELEEALAPDTRALLIGNIVHDSAYFETGAPLGENISH